MPETVIIKYTADTSELSGLKTELGGLSKAQQEIVSDFDKANAAYNRQIGAIRDLEKMQQSLNDAKAKMAKEPAALANINAQIKANDDKLKGYNNTLNAEIGILQRLKAQELELLAARNKATNITQLKDYNDKLKAVSAELKRAESATNALNTETTKGKSGMDALAGAARNVATIIAANFAVSKIGAFAGSVVDTTAKMQSLGKSIDFSSKGRGGTVFTELENQSESLGLLLTQNIEGFQKFSASFIGTNTPLEKQINIYRQLNLAVAAMQLPADKAAAAYNALGQMVSKGKVQAEELRGQLGDALPGAFNLAAKAMGKTTAEFNKMLDTGQVITADFLPRFANLLEVEFGGAAVNSSDSLTASLNRQENAWTSLRLALGNSSGIIKDYIDFSTNLVSGFAKWISGQRKTTDEIEASRVAGNALRIVLGLIIGLVLTYNKAAIAFVASLRTQTVALLTAKGASDALSASLRIGATLLRGLGIGLLITLLTSLTAKIFETTAAQEALNRVNEDYEKKLEVATAETRLQQTAMNQLFEAIKDSNKTLQERSLAMNTLNSKFKEHLPVLINIADKTQDWTKIQAVASANLAKQIQLLAKMDIYREYTRNLVKIEVETESLKRKSDELYNSMGFWGVTGEVLADFVPFYNTELKTMQNSTEANEAEIKRLKEILHDLGSDTDLMNLITQTELLSDGFTAAEKAGKHYADKNAEYLDRIAKLRIENAKTYAAQMDAEVDEAQAASDKRIAIAVIEHKHGQITTKNFNEFLKQEQENVQKQLLDIRIKYLDKQQASERSLLEYGFQTRNQGLLIQLQSETITQDTYNVRRKQNEQSYLQSQLIQLNKHYDAKKEQLAGNEQALKDLEESAGAERLKLEQNILNLSVEINRDMQAKLLEEERRAFESRQNLLKSGGFKDQINALQDYYLDRITLLTRQFQEEDAITNQDQTTRAAHRKQYYQNMIALQTEAANAILSSELQELDKHTNIGLRHQQAEILVWEVYYKKLEELADAANRKRLADDSAAYNKESQRIKDAVDAGTMSEVEANTLRQANNAKFRAAETDATNRQNDALNDIAKQRQKQLDSIDIQYGQKRVALAQQFADQLSTIANSLVQQQQNQNQAALTAIDLRYDKEINRAKDKQKLFDAIQNKTIAQEKANQANITYTARLEKEKAEAEERQKDKSRKDIARAAEFQKAIQIAQAIMATSQAVLGIFAQSEFLGLSVFPLAATIGVAGAAQVALIANTPIPAYAEGGEIPLWAGKPDTDSVVARLMPGERVMTKRANREFGETLKAIHGREISPEVLNNFVIAQKLGFGIRHEDIPYIQQKSEPTVININASEEMLTVLRGLQQTNVSVNADAHGFSVYVEKELSRTKYYNERYKSR